MCLDCRSGTRGKSGWLISSLTDYNLGVIDYNDEYCQRCARTMSPAKWRKTISGFEPQCSRDLVEVAMRLGFIPSSSAASERVWSALGNIHTKKRNRLSNEKIEKLGIVYCGLKSAGCMLKKQRIQAVVEPAVMQQLENASENEEDADVSSEDELL